MNKKHSSFREKIQDIFNRPDLFAEGSVDKTYDLAVTLQALDDKPIYQDSAVVLKLLEVNPHHVRTNAYYFFGRRLRQLYFWYAYDQQDTPPHRRTFNYGIASFIKNRTLSGTAKADLARWAKYYEDVQFGWPDYETLVEDAELNLYYDRIALPVKDKLPTLNYLVEISEVVKNYFFDTFQYMEELLRHEIINDENYERFYLRVLNENNGTPASVFQLLTRWYQKLEEI